MRNWASYSEKRHLGEFTWKKPAKHFQVHPHHETHRNDYAGRRIRVMNGEVRLHLGPSSIVGGSSVNTTLWTMAHEDIRAVTVSRVSLLWTSGL